MTRTRTECGPAHPEAAPPRHACVAWQVGAGPWCPGGVACEVVWDVPLSEPSARATCRVVGPAGSSVLHDAPVRITRDGFDQVHAHTDDGSLVASFDASDGRVLYARTTMLRGLGVPGGRAEIARLRTPEARATNACPAPSR
ncbi:MAG: hypothetical protein SFY69_07670 [Planctomycetota bacterium]|nr:hypothetical protein [Planctomycetota bacterium]